MYFVKPTILLAARRTQIWTQKLLLKGGTVTQVSRMLRLLGQPANFYIARYACLLLGPTSSRSRKLKHSCNEVTPVAVRNSLKAIPQAGRSRRTRLATYDVLLRRTKEATASHTLWLETATFHPTLTFQMVVKLSALSGWNRALRRASGCPPRTLQCHLNKVCPSLQGRFPFMLAACNCCVRC